MSQKIKPMLWFNKDAEEAANFYTSVFPDAAITNVVRSPTDYPNGKAGDVLVISFKLFGQEYTALNGGPEFRFSEAVSLIIECEDQDEVDYYWNKLTADGGQESQCGWLKDRFGFSWQVTPKIMSELLSDKNPKRARGAMQAMMQMKKLDIAGLKAGADAAD